MDFEITFDSTGFEKTIHDLTHDAVREIAMGYEREYAAIGRRCGSDIDAIKTELTRLYRREGGAISDPDLTDHAEAIASGARVDFEIDIKWV